MGYQRVDPFRLKNLTREIFVKAGLSLTDAEIAAEILIVTEMRGVASHGVMRVEKYVNSILSGGIDPKAPLKSVQNGDNWNLFDACRGLGLVASYKAMEHTIALARKNTIAFSLVRNSRHFGAAGYYTNQCCSKGMIGMAMSNGDIIMAAIGANESSIGNNPFSFGAPAGERGPIILDMAMSKLSDGKIQIARMKGEELPPESILDNAGKPSTVPQDYFDGGTLLPFGGHKGYGLAVMVEILAALLSGSSLLKEARAWNREPNDSKGVGHFFLALDFSQIVTQEIYNQRIEALIDELKSASLQPGVEQIYYPGELESIEEKKSKIEGVGLLPETLSSLQRACDKVDLIFDL